MSIFEGYFDESGMHEGGTLGPSLVVVMAGYIATSDQWAMFNNEWQSALDRYGIDCFHMATFNGGHKPFDTLKDDEKDILIDKLTRIITVRARVGIIAYFQVNDYRAVIAEMPGSYIATPYTICSLVCMNTVTRWAGLHGYTEPIPYIFDRGARYSGQFKDAYDSQLKYYSPQSKEWLFGSFILEDKKRFKLCGS